MKQEQVKEHFAKQANEYEKLMAAAGRYCVFTFLRIY